MKILGVIPARKGSKGIPNKNITLLNGKPLIQYTIEASLSSIITDTVVTSDSDTILYISANCGAQTMKRSAELSADDTPMNVVVKDCIDRRKEMGYEYDMIVLLQPTSPLRDGRHINEAIHELVSFKADSLISVYTPKHSPYKVFGWRKKGGYLRALFNNSYPFIRRQDLPEVFMSNGAIYAMRVEVFMKNFSLFTKKTVPYIMPERYSIDVDTIDDIKACEIILNQNK